MSHLRDVTSKVCGCALGGEPPIHGGFDVFAEASVEHTVVTPSVTFGPCLLAKLACAVMLDASINGFDEGFIGGCSIELHHGFLSSPVSPT
jgi:hypothetical protein